MNSENSLVWSVGGEVKIAAQEVGGKMFVFTPNQFQFLLNLQKMKNVQAAALSVDKDEAWGQTFLKSKKFQKFISLKMKSFSDRNGLDVDWWYQFGKYTADGFKEFYHTTCSACGYAGEMDTYEVEQSRQDDLTLGDIPCPACYKPMDLKLEKELFKPSREQVEAWKDLGARLIPKIERVHHQFENSEIVFQSADGGE